MNFLRYVFNRRGFGKTHWLAALWVHCFGIAGVLMAIDGEPWGLLGLVPVLALWWGTWMNYKGYWV